MSRIADNLGAMADMTDAQFKEAFCSRTKELRERTGRTQEAVARALGILADRYGKWETRSPMPHSFIPAFAMICGVTIDDMFKVRLASKAKKSSTKELPKVKKLRAIAEN